MYNVPYCLPLALIVVAVGIYPKLILDLLNSSLTSLNDAMTAWRVAGL